jgi:hypothetical protein
MPFGAKDDRPLIDVGARSPGIITLLASVGASTCCDLAMARTDISTYVLLRRWVSEDEHGRRVASVGLIDCADRKLLLRSLSFKDLVQGSQSQNH